MVDVACVPDADDAELVLEAVDEDPLDVELVLADPEVVPDADLEELVEDTALPRVLEAEVEDEAAADEEESPEPVEEVSPASLANPTAAGEYR